MLLPMREYKCQSELLSLNYLMFSLIFRIAASLLGIQPDEAIFVDDELRFIEAAKALGMVGIQFKDSKQTIEEIQLYLEHNTLEHS